MPVTTKYRTLVDALLSAPAERPFVTSWIDEDEQETATFGEFRRMARVQALLLKDNGVSAGDRVVLIMPQGIPLMATFVGAMLLGAVPAILAYPNFKVEPAKYRFGLAGVTANLHAKVVVIDNEFPDDLLGHVTLGEARLLRAADTGVADANAELPDSSNQPDSLAFIQHSAGTTGLQKGVALTHGAVLRHLEHLSAALKLDETRDIVYSWLPLYHDMGLIACFILPMVCHLHVVMQSPLDWVMHPDTMLQIFTDYKCTLAWLPNFSFQFVPRRTPQERWSNYDMSSARALINCSEPVRASSMNEFYNAFASSRTEAVGAAGVLRDGRKRICGYADGHSWQAGTAGDLGGWTAFSCRALHRARSGRNTRRRIVHFVGPTVARQSSANRVGFR